MSLLLNSSLKFFLCFVPLKVWKENENLRNMKRKSIYVAGSQEQQNLTFDEEPMNTFVPNVESTRLMQNTVNLTLALNTSETNSEDKRSKYR